MLLLLPLHVWGVLAGLYLQVRGRSRAKLTNNDLNTRADDVGKEEGGHASKDAAGVDGGWAAQGGERMTQPSARASGAPLAERAGWAPRPSSAARSPVWDAGDDAANLAKHPEPEEPDGAGPAGLAGGHASQCNHSVVLGKGGEGQGGCLQERDETSCAFVD